MRKYQRSYVYQSTGMERKRNRMKNYRGNECKCFTPFVKLHHHDCPLLKKPCPVHGSSFDHASKGRKKESDGESEECMLLSFHPSIKTDGLLQPILSSRDPETQINAHYFSPKDSTKEILKHRQIQTNPEELKPPTGNKYFVEKAKSYVAGKTNKMKKLKQCFHSPCNSIVQKTRSQTSVHLNEILQEDPKRNHDVSVSEAFGTLPRRRASDDTNIDPSWFCWSKLTSSDGDRSSGHDLSDSDRFLAVARPFKKSNLFNPNLYEMRHHKGSGEVQFFKKKNKKSEWAPHFFTAPDSDYHVNYTTDMSGRKENDHVIPVEKKDPNLNSPKREGAKKKSSLLSNCSSKHHDRKRKSSKGSTGSSRSRSGSEKSRSDSSGSGSVYYTPFIFVPAGMEGSKPAPKADHKAVQAFVDMEKLVEKVPSAVSQPAVPSENSVEVRRANSRLSSDTPTVFIREDRISGVPMSPLRRSIIAETSDTVKATQTSLMDTQDSKSLKSFGVGSSRISDVDKVVGPFLRRSPMRTTADFGLQVDEPRGFQSPPRVYEGQNFAPAKSKNVEGTENKETQTKEKKFRDVQIEAVEPTENKSQMTSPLMAMKSVRTQTGDDSIDPEPVMEVSNQNIVSSLTYIKDGFNPRESKQAIEASPHWGHKSHSESEIYSRKQFEGGKEENEDLALYRCHCNQPGTSPTSKPCGCTQPRLTTILEPVGADPNRGLEEKKWSTHEKMQKIETKDEGNSTSLYDLSELTQLINEHFQKMIDNAKQCRTMRPYESRIDRGIMTDRDSHLSKTDAAIQTSLSAIAKSRDKINIQQSVLLDIAKQTKNVLVCKACKKEISTVLVDVSTSIPEVKPKTVDGEIYCELIKVNSNQRAQVQTSPKSQKPVDFEKNVKPVEREKKPSSPIPLPRRKFSFQSALDSNGVQNRSGEFKDSPAAKPLNTQIRPKTSNCDRVKAGCVCPRTGTRVRRKISNLDVDGPSATLTPPSVAPRPGTANPAPKTEQPSATSPKDKPNSRNDRTAYPVSVSQRWPKNLKGKSLQSNVNRKSKKGFYSDSSIDSAISSFQQKRNLEKQSEPDDNVPTGKKIRSGEIDIFNFCQEKVSEKCFVFGQPKGTFRDPNFRTLIKEAQQHHKSDLGKKLGFIKALSSPTFQSFPSNSRENLRAISQSEQKLKPKEYKSQKRCSSCNLLSSKSLCFRSTDEEKALRKLYECPVCKSFSYLKDPNQDRLINTKLGTTTSHRSTEDKGFTPLSPNEDSFVADSDEEHTLSFEWNATATDLRNLEENTTGDECSADLQDFSTDYNLESQDTRLRDKPATTTTKSFGSFWHDHGTEKQFLCGEREKLSSQVENEVEKIVIEEASEEEYE